MRDSQGQTFWQLCRHRDFAPVTGAIRWNGTRHALTLASEPGSLPEGVPPAQTRTPARRPAMALDALDGWARVERQGGQDRILAGGAVDPESEIFAAAPGVRISEIAVTASDWLVICLDDGLVRVRHLTGQFVETGVQEAGVAPDRIIETEPGTLWLIDRGARVLRRLKGEPLPEQVSRRRRADYVFQQKPLNPDPLRLTASQVDLTSVPEEIIDAMGLPDGRVVLLCLGPGRQSSLRVTDGLTVSDRIDTPLQSAFSMAPLSHDTLAALVPNASSAVALRLDGHVEGTRLPLPRHTGERFCRVAAGVAAHYPSTHRSPPLSDPAKPFSRLVAPSRPAYARQGTARCTIIEADDAETIWHRAYLDAHVPPGCGLTLHMAAGDDRTTLEALPLASLHAHHFGNAGQGTARPHGVWLDMDSERPFLASATGQPRKEDRCGLFSVLIQKSGETVKRLKGRYLRVDVVLTGPGLATPRLYALRLWAGRQSLRDRFLPDYLSVEEGPMAEGSDFLDRQLALFESVLTPIEDEVGYGWRLTRPAGAPANALDWLAGWIGADLDSALSETAKRRMLARSVQLWRRRGTTYGLEQVLNIVTDDALSRGEIVVLEHFRLRRTFATILGADLSDETNPLTPWAAQSGNSHLGQSFVLGEKDQKAFFALFRPDLLDDPLTGEEERQAALDQMAEFFDGHAHRVTVLIHNRLEPVKRDLVARTLERELPAHVVGEIREGPGTLVLALSSMLGVETRFGSARDPQPFTLNAAQIGQAYLTDAAALDPRFEGGA